MTMAVATHTMGAIPEVPNNLLKRAESMMALMDNPPKDAIILDFGCGAGNHTYALIDLGYSRVHGFDVQDCLNLRKPEDRKNFQIAAHTDVALPYADNTFDVIFSDQVFEHVKDQVTIFRELHRITKPGGVQFHCIPSPYYPIERHIRVPLGNLITQRWWFKLWALVGLRLKHQKGLSADETADKNVFYVNESLNYIPSSGYKVIWRKLGFDYRFVDQEYFDAHWRSNMRTIGKVNRIMPIIGWLKRVFKVRHVLLTKR
jgi:SAM-dependent methyltransferase